MSSAIDLRLRLKQSPRRTPGRSPPVRQFPIIDMFWNYQGQRETKTVKLRIRCQNGALIAMTTWYSRDLRIWDTRRLPVVILQMPRNCK